MKRLWSGRPTEAAISAIDCGLAGSRKLGAGPGEPLTLDLRRDPLGSRRDRRVERAARDEERVGDRRRGQPRVGEVVADVAADLEPSGGRGVDTHRVAAGQRPGQHRQERDPDASQLSARRSRRGHRGARSNRARPSRAPQRGEDGVIGQAPLVVEERQLGLGDLHRGARDVDLDPSQPVLGLPPPRGLAEQDRRPATEQEVRRPCQEPTAPPEGARGSPGGAAPRARSRHGSNCRSPGRSGTRRGRRRPRTAPPPRHRNLPVPFGAARAASARRSPASTSRASTRTARRRRARVMQSVDRAPWSCLRLDPLSFLWRPSSFAAVTDFSLLAIAGQVVTPDDGDWDQARSAWNLAADQRPRRSPWSRVPTTWSRRSLRRRQRSPRLGPGTGHAAMALGPLADTVLIKTERMRGIESTPWRGPLGSRPGSGCSS